MPASKQRQDARRSAPACGARARTVGARKIGTALLTASTPVMRGAAAGERAQQQPQADAVAPARAVSGASAA